jgi:putative hydrolase of the HAD superfamily
VPTYNCSMIYTNLFFDLDDTLYPSSTGLWADIRKRMNEYMLDRMRLPPEEIPTIRREFFETYGTTLRGLQIHYQVDTDDFLAYVHDLPIEDKLEPDADLRAMLLSLPQAKWIFTNADANHARRVIGTLGIQDCFDGIIDIRALDWICKPDPKAYQIALSIVSENNPYQCVYLDDALRNLAPAHEMGFFTVLIGQAGDHPEADLTISTPHQLQQAFPALWNNAHKTS